MHPTQEPVAGADVSAAIPTEVLANALDVAIGERVRLALWRARLTQLQLAEALGVDQAAVSRRLRGQTPWKASDVEVAAKLLDLTVADLMAPEAAAS